MEVLGLIGDNDLQQMKPLLSLLNKMLSSLMMILKDKSKEERMAAPCRGILCLLPEKGDKKIPY